MDVLALSRDLIRRASVTPNDDGCQDLLIERLERLGFAITRLAVRRRHELLGAARHRGAAGRICRSHRRRADRAARAMDVAAVRAGRCATRNLFGRGAADMKTALAAMVVAIERLLAATPDRNGSIGLLITSDEEGDAIDGTVKVVDYLQRDGDAHRLLHRRRTIVGTPRRRHGPGRPARFAERSRAHSRHSRSRRVSGDRRATRFTIAAPAMARTDDAPVGRRQ